MEHGHTGAEQRHLQLHRLAFAKLRAAPATGKAKLVIVLDRWLKDPEFKRQTPLLRQWQKALELPMDQLETLVMTDQGQQLRQCSPMGVLLEPQERFSVYEPYLTALPAARDR